MITEAQIVEMIKGAKQSTKPKKFKQSVELIMNFKDIDVKKGFAINEIVQLPKTSSPATVCVMATGDMNQKAKQADADTVIGTEGAGAICKQQKRVTKIHQQARLFFGRYQGNAHGRQDDGTAARTEGKDANARAL